MYTFEYYNTSMDVMNLNLDVFLKGKPCSTTILSVAPQNCCMRISANKKYMYVYRARGFSYDFLFKFSWEFRGNPSQWR